MKHFPAIYRGVTAVMSLFFSCTPAQLPESPGDTPREVTLTGALEALYRGLGGDLWTENDGWCTDAPLSEWYGLSGRISDGDTLWSLTLRANNLQGEIPLEFWEAAEHFEKIIINDAYLPTSVLPDCVWHEQLKELDLSRTFLIAQINPCVANAGGLEALRLDYCYVGALPEEIASLGALRELSLERCGLEGALPRSLGKMKSLETLDIDENPDFGGTLPDGFYELTALRTFSAYMTQIGGTLKKEISALTRLETFDIFCCEFGGTVPEELGTIGSLDYWNLDGNRFTAMPQFVRFVAINSSLSRRLKDPSKGGDWHSGGYSWGPPYEQRDPSGPRPEGFIRESAATFRFGDIIVDGKPLEVHHLDCDRGVMRRLPFPAWAGVRYGQTGWTTCNPGELKFPEYPYADDLRYPAYEYYYDGADWRHPLLDYPAREYVFDGGSWVHDPLCPWDRE